MEHVRTRGRRMNFYDWIVIGILAVCTVLIIVADRAERR